jgi:integrase
MKPHADSTTRTYRYCLERWYKWTRTYDYTRWDDDEELETEVLGFLSCFKTTGKSLATVLQHVSSLSWAMGAERIRTDKVRASLGQYAYDLGRPVKKAKAIGIDELTAMVEAAPSQRDKALLTVGWAGALRASEIVSIRRCDLEQTTEGFELLLPRSKTDQTGKGKTIPIPYFHIARAVICPARNLERFLLRQAELFESLSADDRVFPMTTKTVTRIINRAGMFAHLPASYSSHSLRRGLATTAAQNGIDDRVIMRHGRWKSRAVVDGYIEEGTLWQKTALDFLR